jgi:enoyl-[acyl-carrier-protein] reductase (NADH)
MQSDVANDEDIASLLAGMKQRHQSVHAFISNVAVAHLVKSYDDYQKRALLQSIEYSIWPMFDYTRRIREAFGSYPRYVIGLSSAGPDQYCHHYDFVAGCKALMETLARYAGHRLFEEGVRINVVRAGYVATESLRMTFGPEFEAFATRFNLQRHMIAPEEVGKVILALCSGLLDGVNGQVLRVDRGASFFENLLRLYERHQLEPQPS